MPFVSSSIYHKAKRLALSEGLKTDVFDRHQDTSELQNGAKYIPIDLLFDAYEVADEHLAPGFAVEERDNYSRINLFRDAHRRGVEIANEVSLVMIVNIFHEITGEPIYPIEVGYRHTSEIKEPFTKFFQCPVVFGQAASYLKFKTSDISIPTLKADRTINAYLLERMDEERRGIHAQADQLMKQVHQLIEESLPSGIPSIVQVSDYLGMSPRTLKRRLSEKDISFREYVQKIQKEVAMSLIRNTSQSMAEIAFQTGFSEQSAFNRAFKRWTSKSPADYRKQASS